MNRLPVAVLAVLLLTPSLAAETGSFAVGGSVVDETGAVLPGATVTLTGTGPNRTTVTGENGTFRLPRVPAGQYRLAVSLIGFSTHRQDLAVQGGDLEIPALTLKLALRGEEVVVSASKSESALVDAPATMTVLGPDTLATTPAQNYADLLRSVPGLNIIQMSARDVNVSSRQATSTLTNSQLALLDGRSIYLDFFGLVLWDMIPTNPQDIKQIEVVRGPASAVWGANAMTGVVNIITKSPREAPGGSIGVNGGLFGRTAEDPADDPGVQWGGDFSFAAAPSDTWSFRLSGGYFYSEPFSRPAGRVPVGTHPVDGSIRTGGGSFPTFPNTGTRQPKVDLRVEQELGNGGNLMYQAGYAGTEGIVHTGIGPFDLQTGSYLGYGRVAYRKGTFRLAAFVNRLDGDAPNLMARDASGRPIDLVFETDTFDGEIGYARAFGSRHILTLGGNARHNAFEISIAPGAEDRNEFGAYLQDELFLGDFRLVLGARVDKFGNLSDPVFSPRVSLIWKPAAPRSLRLSYNRAFRAPSTINNYLDLWTVTPVDLSVLAERVPPPYNQFFLRPFPLPVHSTGNPDLKQEQIDAYEAAYTATFRGKTTVGLSVYMNDTTDNTNFVTFAARDPYTAQNPPEGWPAPLAPVLSLMAAQGIYLPRSFTYLNIGTIRQVGVEVSVDHAFNREWSGFANYSWQDVPEPQDPVGDPDRYPTEEISVPPENRVNVGLSYNGSRVMGNVTFNWVDKAFWADVLSIEYHGWTKATSLLSATLGVHWLGGRVTTTFKGTNLLGKDYQQHIFGDVLKRTVTAEVRVKF